MQKINLTASLWDFYLTEIFIVIANIALVILYLRTPQPVSAFTYMSFFILIFFCIEHSYRIIFNKESNSITVLTKALFINKYRIHSRYDLDFFVGAGLMAHRGKSTTYDIEMYTKDGLPVNILPIHSSGNYTHWLNIQRQIDHLYNSNQKYLEIREHPFALRLISIVFMVVIQGSMLQAVLNH